MSGKYKKIRLSRTEAIDRHRIVMELFLGRKLLKNEVVHHKNGIKGDDRIENLELMTLSDHARHHMIGHVMSEITKEKLRNVPHPHGQDQPTSKLKNHEVIVIKKMLEDKITIREIAEIFGVGKTTIQDIKSGETWNKVF